MLNNNYLDKLYSLNFNNINSNIIDNKSNLFQYSIPNIKLYYPEPYIATPSFLHYDIWFVHISIYQYWLWFFFIFLIIFFTLTFLLTLKWCNIRFKPKRETRGVSRSKCGDLITAVVPVTWAGSIITHESTDAIDYFDGFGTTEMSLGVRAYQWGWEYYYPKDLDLNYKVSNNNSLYIGNSLYYNNYIDLNVDSLKFFNYYKNSNILNKNITPAFLLFNPNKNFNLDLNINKQNFGNSKINVQKAFSNLTKSNYFSNSNYINKNVLNIDNNLYDYNKYYKYNSLTDNYSYPNLNNNYYLYYNQLSSLNFSIKYYDVKSIKDYINFNLNNRLLNLNNLFFLNNYNYNNYNLLNLNYSFINKNLLFFYKFNLNNLYINIINNNESLTNKLLFKNFNYTLNNNNIFNDNFNDNLNFKNFNKNINNLYNNFKNFNFLKKNNLKSINSEVNINYYYNYINNKFIDYFNFNSNNSLNDLYNNYKNLKYNSYLEFIANKKKFSYLFFENSLNSSNFLNKFNKTSNYILESYNLNKFYENNYNLFKIIKLLSYFNNLNSSNIPLTYFYADIDFKRWNNFELLDNNINNIELDEELIIKIKNHNSRFNYNSKFNYNYLNLINFKDNGYMVFKYLNKFDLLLFNNKLNLFNSISNSLISYKNTFKNFNKNFKNMNLQPIIDNNISLQFNSNYITSNLYNINKYINLRGSNYNNILNMLNFNYIFINNTTKINNFYNYNVLISNYYNFKNKFTNINDKLSSYKNINILNKSIWKIYYSYFDESRSSTFFRDFSNLNKKIPIITQEKKNPKNLFYKNNSTYVNLNIYNKKKIIFKNFLSNYNNLKNFLTYEFPFNLSVESDSIRYTWFDWYSNYSKRISKALDTIQYNLNGSKVFQNKYNFNGNDSNYVNNYEKYILKLTHARRIYLPNFLNSMYTYNKINSFNNIYNIINMEFREKDYYKVILLSKYMFWYNNNFYIDNLNFNNLNENLSNYQIPSRNYWKSVRSFGSLYYYNYSLNDILFKKNYLLNKLITKKYNYNYNYSKINSNLLLDFKSLLSSNTFIENNNEFLKINSLIFKNKLNKDFLKNFNFYKYYNYIFKTEYILNKKSQYKPMRKGIANMIRIQVDNSITLPVDTRIQLLTVSKDIIHSWSIPSAGIKIDCIPGYSSHKVTIFLLSGIYWGQCMEICGRFHHWMPILVYFIKRDLFFIWCNHFIFFNKNNNKITQNINKLSQDFSNIVSFNNLNWVYNIK